MKKVPLSQQKCKHKGCDHKRFLRLWAVGYCYEHAFEHAKKSKEREVYR